MSGAEVLQVVASAISIVECSVKLAKFMKHLKDDSRDIHDWLVEMKESIDTLQNVLDFVKLVANGPNMQYADDGPTEWICTIVQACNDRAAKINKMLPPIPKDGLLSRIDSVLRKLIDDRAIKEHEVAIQRWITLLQTIIVTLSLDRISHLARDYEDHDDEFDRISAKVNTKLSHSLPCTPEASIYHLNEGLNFPTSTQTHLSIIHKSKQHELQHDQTRVAKLESERKYLEAAKKQGHIIKLRRELNNHMPLSAQDEAVLVERQADLLLQCHTIGRRYEATRLLDNFINHQGRMLTEEMSGRIKLRIGELYLAKGRLGSVEKIKRAATFLEEATTALEKLLPFPHHLYPRSMVCLVRALETLQNSDDALRLKSLMLSQYSDAELDCDINWEYKDELDCKALEWCRTNPAFDVDSAGFKFDDIIQGTSAVHLAVRDGNIAVLREMLVEVEQIDALDSDGCTPLLIAAQERCSDIFELLLDHKASLTKADRSGQTVLHKCQTCSSDGRDIAIARLIHGHEPSLMNIKDSTGKTALWMACEEGNEKMVEFLLAHDADPKIPSNKNKTTLQVAVDMMSSNGTRQIHPDRLRIIEMLLKHDVDSNETDSLGNTPLYTAASIGDLEVVQLLLDPDYNTRVDYLGRRDQTPLAAAVENRRVPVIKELVSRGASVTLKGVGRNAKSAEDWAKGHRNKELRDAFRVGDSRRMSQNSMGNTSATSSNSLRTRDSATSQPLRRLFGTGGRS